MAFWHRWDACLQKWIVGERIPSVALVYHWNASCLFWISNIRGDKILALLANLWSLGRGVSGGFLLLSNDNRFQQLTAFICLSYPFLRESGCFLRVPAKRGGELANEWGMSSEDALGGEMLPQQPLVVHPALVDIARWDELGHPREGHPSSPSSQLPVLHTAGLQKGEVT